jgi:hypothetical protein
MPTTVFIYGKESTLTSLLQCSLILKDRGVVCIGIECIVGQEGGRDGWVGEDDYLTILTYAIRIWRECKYGNAYYCKQSLASKYTYSSVIC